MHKVGGILTKQRLGQLSHPLSVNIFTSAVLRQLSPLYNLEDMTRSEASPTEVKTVKFLNAQ